MTSQTKIGIIFAIVLILAAGYAYLQMDTTIEPEEKQAAIEPEEKQAAVPETPAPPQRKTDPTATGNPDDIVADVLSDSATELSAFNDEMTDASLISIDGQEINDLGQSYDENKL